MVFCKAPNGFYFLKLSIEDKFLIRYNKIVLFCQEVSVMRIAIIEDNEAEALALNAQVQSCTPKELKLAGIDLYETGEAFLNSNIFYDLALIDCQLPGCSGVELGKEIRKTNNSTAICYVTAFMEYAVEGYEANAFRYLLKPVSNDKLTEALSFFAERLKRDKLIELTGSMNSPVFARMSEIVYVEAALHRTVVRLRDAHVTSRRSMKDFEKELNSVNFFRTHSHSLVNFQYIEEKNDKTLKMLNGEIIQISRRNINAFNTAFMAYLRRG